MVGCSDTAEKNNEYSEMIASDTTVSANMSVVLTDIPINKSNADYSSALTEINKMAEVVQLTVNGDPIYTKDVLGSKLSDENAVNTSLTQIN